MKLEGKKGGFGRRGLPRALAVVAGSAESASGEVLGFRKLEAFGRFAAFKSDGRGEKKSFCASGLLTLPAGTGGETPHPAGIILALPIPLARRKKKRKKRLRDHCTT